MKGPIALPGAGVVAQGGRYNNIRRLKHGAGVIGIAGGVTRGLPSPTDTGSVGVYGQGAEAEIRNVPIDSIPTVIGPLEPGPGVLGKAVTNSTSNRHVSCCWCNWSCR